MKQINNETKLVTITRRDISDGYVVVQTAHAVADFAAEHPIKFKDWKSNSNSIITLSISDEKSLLKIYNKLKELTEVSIFFEPDVDSYTSLAIYGTPEVRKLLSYLPLALKIKNK